MKKSSKKIEPYEPNPNKELSGAEREELLSALEDRFEKHMARHKGIAWADVEARLEANGEKLWSLNEMERTGGEPDVIGQDEETGEFVFCDCSAQSPDGRRKIVYDGEAQAAREKKGVYPRGNAVDMAAVMGIELLTEEAYRELQELGDFDTSTSSWIKTPAAIRELGGALFADLRYDHIFIYHNSAPSFYSARGFRGSLKV
jgi:hypothetical protein